MTSSVFPDCLLQVPCANLVVSGEEHGGLRVLGVPTHPPGPLTDHQSPPQASHQTWLEQWGGAEEIGVSPPALPPSLPPCSQSPRGCRDRCTAQPGPISLCPAQLLPSPSRSLSHPEPHMLPLPRALCPRLPCPATWAGGSPGTSPGSQPGEDRGAGQPLGLSGPQGGCCCCFPAPRRPFRRPCLPFPTAFWAFLCFSVPSARKAPALCTSLLAGHGIGH